MKFMYAHLFAIKHIDIHLITEGPSSGRSFLQNLLEDLDRKSNQTTFNTKTKAIKMERFNIMSTTF